jgi:hypothetical protein
MYSVLPASALVRLKTPKQISSDHQACNVFDDLMAIQLDGPDNV